MRGPPVSRHVKRIAIIALAALAPLARAHDFWIEPSTFRPAVGQMVSTTLRVGQEFVGDPIPRSAQFIDSFVVRDGSNEREVIGFENRDPAGYLRIEQPGLRSSAIAAKRTRSSSTPRNSKSS